MLRTLSAVLAIGVGFIFWSAGCEMHERPSVTGIQPGMGDRALSMHPASQALSRLFPSPDVKAPSDFKPFKMTSADYLTLVEANVDFYKQHLNEQGAIIDPVKHVEIQYSTPAFALAAATLVANKHREDLLEPAVRAMTFATHAGRSFHCRFPRGFLYPHAHAREADPQGSCAEGDAGDLG